MTPDLQARIERLARKCVKAAIICECQSCQIGAVRSVKNALTTLAEQIIAEKDAEAAAMRAKLDEAESQAAAMRGRLELGGKVAARIGVAHGKDVIERLSDWWYQGTLQLLYKDGIQIHTAGRDLLAELTSLRDRVKELEGRIERYENSGRV